MCRYYYKWSEKKNIYRIYGESVDFITWVAIGCRVLDTEVYQLSKSRSVKSILALGYFFMRGSKNSAVGLCFYIKYR